VFQLRVSKIKILHLEDSELDAQLLRHALEEDQFMFEITWIDNFQDYKVALQQQKFDLILADYSLPDCDGIKAFNEAKAQAGDIPFILVTGALGEEKAIDSIKYGITDYVLKTNLLRLNLAIPRALEEAKKQRQNRQTLEALHLSENRFDLAVRGSGAGIWDWEDMSVEAMWWSPRIYEMFGYPEEEIAATRSQLYRLMLPEDAEDVQKGLATHIAKRTPYDVEYRIIKKSGEMAWIRSRGQSVCIDGVARRMAGYMQDVTNKKQTQEVLRTQQRDLFQAQEVANIGCWTYDLCLDKFFWTPLVYRIYGFDVREFDGSKTAELSRVHPEDLSRVKALWDKGLSLGRIDYEHRLLVDGQVRWVHQVADIEYDERNQPVKIIGVVHDISNQRKAEDERRKADERSRVITDAANDSIIMIDQHGTVVFWNPASERIFGYPAEAILGKTLHQTLHHSEKQPETCLCGCLQKVVDEHKANFPTTFELTVKNSQNQPIQLEMHASAIRQDDQWFGLGIIRDVSERRHLESQLMQTQKMEAIGALAGGIAHDFNNILASVLGYSSMVERHLQEGSREKEDIKQVINAAERAKQLVRQILTFSRKSQTEMAPVYIDMVIKEVLKLIRPSLPSTIDVKVDLKANADPVLGDVTQVHQILMNLCTNAYHAMPEGGTLSISLHKVAVHAGEFMRLDAGDYLELRVMDSGTGISPEDIPQIFDPYFTTKDVDTGTGLGLSVVRGITDSMGGHIDVESTLGKGTCFRLLLPCYSGPRTDAVIEKVTQPKGNRQHILVVDDEEALAQLLQKFLKDLGYQAESRTSSLSALEEIRANPQKYVLLITDQTMPQMTGIQLAQEAYKLNPKLPVVLCSGLRVPMERAGITETAICHIALKTELLEDLSSVLREVFGGK
jgi:PAS domain S-box-containing protein